VGSSTPYEINIENGVWSNNLGSCMKAPLFQVIPECYISIDDVLHD